MAVYKNKYTEEIIFPLGGIGSGSIGLTGNGRLVDFEIFGRPNKNSDNGETHFAVRAKKKDGTVIAKVLNGDYYKNLYGKNGIGADTVTMAGFDHFKETKFTGEFPIAKLEFVDETFPGKIVMTAFNPFIPLDDKNSSIPGAFFSISVENNTNEEIEYSVVFAMKNTSNWGLNISGKNKNFTYINYITAGKKRKEKDFFELTAATDAENAYTQSYWYRGGWKDSISTYWRELSSGEKFTEREYSERGQKDGSVICADIKLNPKEKKSVRYVLTWNMPTAYTYWHNDPVVDKDGKEITWKNYYATVWKTSNASAFYSLKRFDKLLTQTLKFKNSLYSTTLDKKIVEAAGANLEVLKSSTVLRLENGEFYGWEGAYPNTGSCEGTCSHVWGYAYALPFLFPKLQRSIADVNYNYNMFEDGSLAFRVSLPLREGGIGWNMPCLDGQMVNIMNVYREWKISGDDEWLKKIWPKAKKSLEYAWSKDGFTGWDRNKDGVLEGRQHHTLDMEIFGPCSWLEGMYLSALKAAAEIETYFGNEKDAKEYLRIFESGKKWTDENLFNGRYYFQKIDLSDRSVLSKYPNPKGEVDWVYHGEIKDSYWHSEAKEIKYQIGEGCEIDQLLGQWHSNILGLGDIFDKKQRLTALKSIYDINFKRSMRSVTNPWRLFSLNDDAGVMICEYPKGAYKPVIPIPYCEETMHGFEYAVAGLMISEGMIDEGTEIVKSIRERYNGSNRNPFNEMECGYNYARSMASFALIPLMSGFKFDIPHGLIGFDPMVNKTKFKSIWSLDSAWGTVKITEHSTEIRLAKGKLTLSALDLPYIKGNPTVFIDSNEVKATKKDGKIYFDKTDITKRIIIKY